MIKFKGQVLTVKDEVREFAQKDKDGNRTDKMMPHRVVEIVLLVKDGTASRPVVVRGFDAPASFVSPSAGDTWESPEIVEYKSKFRAIPECSIF